MNGYVRNDLFEGMGRGLCFFSWKGWGDKNGHLVT